MKQMNGNVKHRIKRVKSFVKDSETLLKDVENLTSKIYNENLSNLKSFKEVLAIVDKKLISKIPNTLHDLHLKGSKKQLIIKKNNENKDKQVISSLIEKIKNLESNQSKLLKKLQDKDTVKIEKRFV